jgi:hypothetical protein
MALVDPSVARRMWLALEPIHAAIYFAPETREIYGEAGLKGYWMGYFASRSAAFGRASPELVMATFYNFAERMVRRAIPDAWTFSSPEAVLAARLRLADLTTRRILDGASEADTKEAADLAGAAARAARPEGRPLFAAHAALPWPVEPHLRLWHATTLLREHRGDGHVAVLVDRDVSGIESHVLSAAAGNVDVVTQKPNRGITDEEWDAAVSRLRSRGFLDADASFTAHGREFKRSIEDRTDALAVQPYAEIGDTASERLLEVLDGFAGRSDVPYPNAMGLTRSGNGA